MKVGITSNQRTYLLIASASLIVFGVGMKAVETAGPHIATWDVASWFKAPRRPVRPIPPPLPQPAPAQPRASSPRKVTFSFTNTGTREITLFWVDAQGEEKPVVILGKGDGVTQGSPPDRTWVIRLNNGQEVKRFLAKDAPPEKFEVK